MSMILDGSNGVTFNDSSLQGAAASPYVLKNRIINGDMRIDQRNASASVNPSGTADTYTLDRWMMQRSVTGKFTVQQNAGSITPPAGYANYLGVTSSSSYTVGASETFNLQQRIEGYNMQDFAWGTASAKTVTLSFWIYSSLTGTFGGAISNGSYNRGYPFTYTISSANTWTQISITIPGDTSGSWSATNGVGIYLIFGLGVGSSQSGTAGAWAASGYNSATGAVSVVGTNGATWYVTGVQLEIGSTATPFERRMYGQELALCQRYYQQIGPNSTAGFGMGGMTNSTRADLVVTFKVTMRTAPGLISASGTNYFNLYKNSADTFFTNFTQGDSTPDTMDLRPNSISGTAGQVGYFTSNNAAAYIAFSAEL